MLNIYIQDNNVKDSQTLQFFIKKWSKYRHIDVQIAIETNEVTSPLQVIAQYDIVFLNVANANTEIFKMAKKVQEMNNFTNKIIFTTSNKELMVDAYSMDTKFFLHKPITQLQIFEYLDAIFADLLALKQSRILLKQNGETICLNINKIIFVEAQLHSVVVHLLFKKYVINYSISNIEKLLPSNQFIRVHRSYIINLSYFSKLKYPDVTLADMYKVPISKNGLGLLNKTLSEYYEI